MGGFYQDINSQYRVIHWACRDCIVRPMCIERCDRLLLQHWLCEDCEKDIAGECDDPCDKVERSKLFERMSYIYGDKLRNIMTEQMEQTSIFSLLRIPSK